MQNPRPPIWDLSDVWATRYDELVHLGGLGALKGIAGPTEFGQPFWFGKDEVPTPS